MFDMSVTLRDAIITVCKKINDRFIIDPIEIESISRELRKITGTVTSRYHKLYMDFFNLAALRPNDKELKKLANTILSAGEWINHFPDADLEEITPVKLVDLIDSHKELKSYSQLTLAKMLLDTSLEIFHYFEWLNSADAFTDTIQIKSGADKTLKNLRLMYNLVTVYEWKNKEDHQSAINELHKIYQCVEGYSWQTTYTVLQNKEKQINLAQSLVEKMHSLQFEPKAPAAKCKITSSGEYLRTCGMFSGSFGSKPISVTGHAAELPVIKPFKNY